MTAPRVEVVSFDRDRGLCEAFAALPEALYAEDGPAPGPPREETLRLLSPDSPFRRKPGARSRFFLASRGGAPLGRLAASVDPELGLETGDPLGAVGLFECAEDADASRALLAEAAGWLRAQGLGSCWGPLNFDIWHGYRLMTRGFAEPPFAGEPRNKAYYPGLFEAFGFSPARRWVTIEVSGREALSDLIERGKPAYERLLKAGYAFRPLAEGSFEEEVRRLHPLLTRSFSKLPGFVPIDLAEFERLLAQIRPVIDARCSGVALDATGALAGFSGAHLDWLPRASRGTDAPEAAAGRARPGRILYFTAGITPEERRGATGLGRAGLYYTVNRMLEAGYETVVFALMEEGGRAASLLGPAARGRATREYAVYELKL